MKRLLGRRSRSRRARGRRLGRDVSEAGQAVVELALVAPLVAVVVLVVLQVGSVMRDATALTAAARAAARRAMVDADLDAIEHAALGETHLDPHRLAVSVTSGSPGEQVTVVVRYRSPTETPIVGRFIADVVMSERFVVLRE